MDTLVIPNIANDSRRDRAVDELPQSAAGRTIMTTEPKFIPEDAVEVNIGGNATFKVRMIDCVGYIVPSAIGYIEDEQPRMVKTPWFEDEIPFNMAAEIGTKRSLPTIRPSASSLRPTVPSAISRVRNMKRARSASSRSSRKSTSPSSSF